MIKVLIADDNKNFCLHLVNYVIKYCDNMRIIGIATNGKKAISTIEELKPDILLLDIKMPYLSGIDIADYVKRIEGYSPKIAFISGDIEGIRCLKKKYEHETLIEKSISFDSMIKVLNNMVQDIEDKNLKCNIDNILIDLCFAQTNIGYKYIKEAIYLGYINSDLLVNLEKNYIMKLQENIK